MWDTSKEPEIRRVTLHSVGCIELVTCLDAFEKHTSLTALYVYVNLVLWPVWTTARLPPRLGFIEPGNSSMWRGDSELLLHCCCFLKRPYGKRMKEPNLLVAMYFIVELCNMLGSGCWSVSCPLTELWVLQVWRVPQQLALMLILTMLTALHGSYFLCKMVCEIHCPCSSLLSPSGTFGIGRWCKSLEMLLFDNGA